MLAWLLGILGIGSAGTVSAILFPSFGAAVALTGKSMLAWLSRRSLGEIAGIVLAVLLVTDHAALIGAHHEAAKLRTQVTNANAARDAANAALAQTVQNYRAAADQAAKADAANKARVEAEQAQISKEQSDEYQVRIAAARAGIARLQQKLAAAHPGGPAAAPVPGVPTPACGTDAPTLDPATRAFDCAIQLDELIEWVKRQHGVDPNTGAAAK